MAVVSSQGVAAANIRFAQTSLDNIAQDQLDEETGIRGFEASGNRLFLQPYFAAEAVMGGHFEKLRQAFDIPAIRAYSPASRRALLLEDIHAEWERTVAEPVVSGRETGADPLVMVEGKALVDRFRIVATSMNQSIQLAEAANDRGVRRNIVAVGAAGVALALLVAIAQASLIRRTAALERQVEQEQQIQRLADDFPQIVWTADAAGSITWFNHAFHAVTGTIQGSLPDDSIWAQIVHPDDRARIGPIWRDSVARAVPVKEEVRVKPKRAGADAYRWMYFVMTPVIGQAGRVERWIGSAIDIHERKGAEDLLEHERRLLAEVMPQIVWQTDGSGFATFFNSQFYSYTGLTPEQALGNGWACAIHPDDLEKTLVAWNNALAQVADYEIEYRIIEGRTGNFRWFLGRGNPVVGEGGAIERWIGTCTDIDAQKRLAEQDHRVSESFQRAALPKTLPQLENVAIDAVYRGAATETFVGGDWFDAFVLSDGRLAFSVGDVMGKGLEAAVTMNAVRQCIRGTARVVQYPTTILDAVDEVIREDEPQAMVTAFLGILDPRSMVLSYASAGHPPPIVRYLDGTVGELAVHGLPIGYRRFRTRYEAAATADLSGAELIVVYTDGLTEATRDATRGELLLREAIASSAIVAAENPAEALARTLLAGGAPDDVAILTLRLEQPRVAAAPSRWSLDVDARRDGSG
jgi:PAS domain S-box-containing protein